MLKIVLCSPDREKLAPLGTMIKNTLAMTRSSYELSTYLSYGKIVENLEVNPLQYEVLILDAQEIGGELIAQSLRKKNLQASVIFICKELQDIEHLLKYRPTGLILDINDTKKTSMTLKDSIAEQKRIEHSFVIKNRDQILKINYSDIDFFENNQRVVTLHNHTKRENIAFYAKFDDVYQLLPKDTFFKCHQSFIINLSMITSLDKVNKKFTLASGQTIDISKRILTEAIEAFNNFNDTFK